MKDIQNPVSRSLVETVLVVLLFMGLLYALYNVLEVFFGVLTFALIFSVSFASTYERMVKLLKGKRKLTGVIYSAILISIVAVPLIFLISCNEPAFKRANPMACRG